MILSGVYNNICYYTLLILFTLCTLSVLLKISLVASPTAFILMHICLLSWEILFLFQIIFSI